jgi:hypothetical protein
MNEPCIILEKKHGLRAAGLSNITRFPRQLPPYCDLLRYGRVAYCEKLSVSRCRLSEGSSLIR